MEWEMGGLGDSLIVGLGNFGLFELGGFGIGGLRGLRYWRLSKVAKRHHSTLALAQMVTLFEFIFV